MAQQPGGQPDRQAKAWTTNTRRDTIIGLTEIWGHADSVKLIFDVLQPNAPKSMLISTLSTPNAMIRRRPACDRPSLFAESKSRA